MNNNSTRRLSGCVYQSNKHNEISVNLNHFKETTEKGMVKSIYEEEVTT